MKAEHVRMTNTSIRDDALIGALKMLVIVITGLRDQGTSGATMLSNNCYR
jgi:hypothetical protein